MTHGSLFRETDGRFKRDVRRWAWRHPHIVAWRLTMWLVFKHRLPPSWVALLWIDPAPLRGAELDALRAHVARLESEADRG